MDEQLFADKVEITELSNKLFMYVDAQQWDKVLDEVFTENVWFDMTSAGGPAKELPAKEICELWREGFSGLDAIHHQAGHYLININETKADIYAYAIATHYKKTATKGNSRMFVGSYELKALKTVTGWRLSQFKYNLKYVDGNASLQ
jgi:hypothetical protein